ncbi:MAG: hypothetical protein WA751_07510 [Candidatus Dormiibacterota bacterium]
MIRGPVVEEWLVGEPVDARSWLGSDWRDPAQTARPVSQKAALA